MSTTPEDLAAFPNRYAVEREIEAVENPAPGTMHLNDGHERVRLPGGTLRRMLAVINQLAAMASNAQQGEPVSDWLNKFMPVVAIERAHGIGGPAQVEQPERKGVECRIELVTAIHVLASHYETRLHRLDPDDRTLAEGDIAHALKIAAQWNWNGDAPPAGTNTTEGA